MNIVMVSSFRNMSGRINGYFHQAHALLEHVRKMSPDHNVRIVAVEGDSFDETERELAKMAELWLVPVDIVKHEHGQRIFGSTEDAERLEALTGVMKAGLAKVRPCTKAKPEGDDVMLYVESDLVWKPHEVGSVIDIAYEQREGFDIVAPLIYAGEAFYDIWGFVGLDGQRFSPFYPYHQKIAHTGVVEVRSVGSCFAMRAKAVAKIGTKFPGKEALRSFCAAARRKNLRIGAALDFRVDHP